MQRLQPVGVAGIDSNWGKGAEGLWPGVNTIMAQFLSKPGVAVDFAKAQKLFKPKLEPWRAARASPNSRIKPPAVTLEQVLGVMDSVRVPDDA